MKTLTVLCNLVLFGFTCLVLVTDGTPTQAVYAFLGLLLLLVPIFTVAAILRSTRKPSWGLPGIIGNIVLLAFGCWAFVDQYPHPDEEGFVAYVVLMALTPVLSVVWFLRTGHGSRRLQAHV